MEVPWRGTWHLASILCGRKEGTHCPTTGACTTTPPTYTPTTPPPPDVGLSLPKTGTGKSGNSVLHAADSPRAFFSAGMPSAWAAITLDYASSRILSLTTARRALTLPAPRHPSRMFCLAFPSPFPYLSAKLTRPLPHHLAFRLPRRQLNAGP